MDDTEPKAEEDQIDVAAGAVLQCDQRIGNPRPGVKREGEPPEGFSRLAIFVA